MPKLLRNNRSTSASAFLLVLACGLAFGCLRRERDAEPDEQRAGGETRVAAAIALRTSGDSSATDDSGAYKPGTGPFRVATADFELRDVDRKKSLPVRVRWPVTSDAPGSQAAESADRPPVFPLIVFSHGAGGDSDAFPQLSKHWASHGYVVVHPTHSDSIRLRRAQGEKLENIRNAAQQVVRKVRPEERVEDVKQVLDSIDEIEGLIASQNGAVRINRDRIAVAGHSAGALTTQMIAGLRFTGRGRLLVGDRDFSDPRVRAAIVISGQGLGRPALARDSWQLIRIPMMVYAGSEDYSPVSDETPAGRRHPFEFAPPGDKFLVFIEGATHGSYQGRLAARVIGEKPPANTKYITDVVAFGTLAFLDAYLKDDAAARDYLSSDALAEYPGGRLEFLRK